VSDALDIRAMLAESAGRLFADHVDAKVLDAAKEEGWSPALWRTVEEAQLHLVSIPEDAGGAGGSVSDLAAVLRLAGRHSAPVPLAETAMLAGWMLAQSGLAIPAGPLTAGPVRTESLRAERAGNEWRLSGTLDRIPFARIADHIVVLADGPDGGLVCCVERARCTIVHGRNLAREPRDEVKLDGVTVPAALAAPAGPGVTLEKLFERGALARALTSAGALEYALDLACRYATERSQFGRKIGQFQAIQQELARAAGEVAAAVAAALSAAGVVDRGGNALLAIASAKMRTAQSALEVGMVAHQVHGAIGVTDEYALHHATLRLWAWRDEFGNEAHWSATLGRALLAGGADGLWPALSREQEET
jgi:acyl-CoA dehydrogenase